MFRRRPESNTGSPLSGSTHDSPSAGADKLPIHRINPETRQYAMAAVILEEWLHELAAIAHEQSILQREQAYQVGLGLDANHAEVVVTQEK